MKNILFLGRDQTTIHIANFLWNKESINKIIIADTNEDLFRINKNDYQIIIIPLRGITKDGVIPSLFENLIIDNDWFKDLSKETMIFTPSPHPMLNGCNIISYINYNDVNNDLNNITVSCILNVINNVRHDNICIIGYNEITKILMHYLSDTRFNIGINSIFDWLQVGSMGINTCNKKSFSDVIANSDIVINTVNEQSIDEDMLCSMHSSYFIDMAGYPYGCDKQLLQKYRIPHLDIWDLYEMNLPYHFGKSLSRKISSINNGKH